MDSVRGKRIRQLLEDYVGRPTHTATRLENNNQAFFEQYFTGMPYFRERPGQWGLYPIPHDPLGRQVPWGLLLGGGRDTIVLIHHSDTVDTQDYGSFQPLAHQPRALTQAYAKQPAGLDAETRQDLQGGGWLFGRGVADMKGGAAIHLALFEEYASHMDLRGNLLLLSLPDEENLSAGMRAAVGLMVELQQAHQLNYVLLLDVEPQERTEETLMRVYDGSVGKLMPVCYARGKVAHVGQVFQGLNPVHLLSEIVTATELSPDFLEQAGNTKTPPPVWLNLRDRKEVYDVSLPPAAAGYMSVLTLGRQAQDIMAQLHTICQQAFDRVIDRTTASYRRYTGDEKARLPWQARVMTYEDARQLALRDAGEACQADLASFEPQVARRVAQGELSLAEAAFLLIERTLSHLKDKDPLVVLAMAPPYYPHVSAHKLAGKGQAVAGLIRHLEDFAQQALGSQLYVENYYTGISDLSYGMFEGSRENTDFIQANMLLWGEMYSIPFDEIRGLAIPVFNIGPWGKDFHKATERVNLTDLCQRVPEMVNAAIRHLLA
ncbi:MAG: M20/M25/M40 family metallo-hydrolase [Clostridiales bacterium]|nr:M20/M25/M40 family metallo-hydrolase [Clostridiales bacterium]